MGLESVFQENSWIYMYEAMPIITRSATYVDSVGNFLKQKRPEEREGVDQSVGQGREKEGA